MIEIDALERQAHLLIVDDDERIRSLLQKFLSSRGAQCTLAANANAARNLLDSMQFDLLLLDVTMPGEDGFSLLRSIRSRASVPVILLTARGIAQDRIQGLALGADDYVAKPFEPDELLLRINAVLRRSASALQPDGPVRFGPFTFDPITAILLRHQENLHVTQAEQSLLRALVRIPGDILSREDLARRLQINVPRSVDVLVTRLRRKLEANAEDGCHLQTVRGKGYRLNVQ